MISPYFDPELPINNKTVLYTETDIYETSSLLLSLQQIANDGIIRIWNYQLVKSINNNVPKEQLKDELLKLTDVTKDTD